MYVIIAPIQVKEGFMDEFIKEIIDDAKGSVNDEPGCLRFDVIQDAGDPTVCGSTRSTETKRRSRPTPKRPISSSGGMRPPTCGSRVSKARAEAARTFGLPTGNGSSRRRVLIPVFEREGQFESTDWPLRLGSCDYRHNCPNRGSQDYGILMISNHINPIIRELTVQTNNRKTLALP